MTNNLITPEPIPGLKMRPFRPADPEEVERYRRKAPKGPRYEDAMVILGRIMLEKEGESFTPWYSTRKIAGLCRTHWVHLPGLDYSIFCVTAWIERFMTEEGEVRGEGVKMIGRTEKVDGKRDPQWFVSFRKLYPDGNSA